MNLFEKLIEYTEVEEWCPEMFGFFGVTFLENFGPSIKKGDKFDGVWFNIEKGTCQVYDTPDNMIQEFPIKLEYDYLDTK